MRKGKKTKTKKETLVETFYFNMKITRNHWSLDGQVGVSVKSIVPESLRDSYVDVHKQIPSWTADLKSSTTLGNTRYLWLLNGHCCDVQISLTFLQTFSLTFTVPVLRTHNSRTFCSGGRTLPPDGGRIGARNRRRVCLGRWYVVTGVSLWVLILFRTVS